MWYSIIYTQLYALPMDPTWTPTTNLLNKRPLKDQNDDLSNTLISVSMLIWKTGIGHCGNDVAQKTVAKVFVLSATKFLAKSDLHWIGDCHV